MIFSKKKKLEFENFILLKRISSNFQQFQRKQSILLFNFTETLFIKFCMEQTRFIQSHFHQQVINIFIRIKCYFQFNCNSILPHDAFELGRLENNFNVPMSHRS